MENVFSVAGFITRRPHEKPRRFALASLSVALLFTMFPRGAVAGHEVAGTLGAAFLKIPVGAQAMTVPGIVAGMQPDASLIFSNPAFLTGLSTIHVSLTRANWLGDLSWNAFAIALPTRWELNWSIGSSLLTSGGLKGYDSSGQTVAEDRYYGLDVSTALGRRFPDLGVGVSVEVTYVREHLPLQTGTGVVFSVAGSYEHAGHRVGLVARDIGGPLSFPGRDYPIDSRLSIGYGRSFHPPWGGLDLGAELTASRSRTAGWNIGVSYLANPFLTLRTGFERVFAAPPRTQLPIKAGFGFHLGRLSLDYAYTPQEYFSTTHTVSLSCAFAGRDPASTGSKRGQGTTPHSGRDSPTPYAGSPTSAQFQPSAAPGEKSHALPGSDPSEPSIGTEGAQIIPGSVVPTPYVVVAGLHSTMESAQAEARSLKLLGVATRIESAGRYVLVVVGRYRSRKEAEAAVDQFRNGGHVFRIMVEND